jgi:hypothetical protein
MMSAYNLTYGQRGEIVGALLECPSIADSASRKQVLEVLPFYVDTLPRDDTHVFSIVSVCTSTPRGLEALLDALQPYDGDKEPFHALHQTLQNLLPQAVLWEEMTALRALLAVHGIPDEDARAAYRRIVSPNVLLPEGWSPGNLYVYVLDYLAKTAVVPGTTPLVKFLAYCRSAINDPQIQQYLAKWLADVAARSGDNLVALYARSAAAAQPSAAAPPAVSAQNEAVLLIKIAPAIQTEGEYLVDAWLFLDDRSVPVHVPLPPAIAEAKHKLKCPACAGTVPAADTPAIAEAKHKQECLADVIETIATASQELLPKLTTEITILAYAVAYELGLGEALVWPITTRSMLQQGLYSYDAIGRLQEVALRKSREEEENAGSNGQETDPTQDIGRYIRLGPLGTAMLGSLQPSVLAASVADAPTPVSIGSPTDEAAAQPKKRPRVLLIDEIDKSDVDLPNDLLNVFEEGGFEIPELSRLPEEVEISCYASLYA